MSVLTNAAGTCCDAIGSGAKVFVACALTILFTACTAANSVRQIEVTGQVNSAVEGGRSVVVIGLGMEGPWDHHEWGISFSQYDPVHRSLAGSCFRFEEVNAARSTLPGDLVTLAFSVPSGHYVYRGVTLKEASPTNLAKRPNTRSMYFEARAGEVYFLGDFILIKGPAVERRMARDRIVDLAKQFEIPITKMRSITYLATDMPVPHFLCAP